MKATFTKFGPKHDYRGAHVTLEYAGRTLLGEIKEVIRNDVTGCVICKVRHFCGDWWPVEPAPLRPRDPGAHMTPHGTERSRKEVTDYSEPVELENTITGEKFSMSMSCHTYTQTEKYCRNCGWVTCKGILGALLCPGECGETWL